MIKFCSDSLTPPERFGVSVPFPFCFHFFHENPAGTKLGLRYLVCCDSFNCFVLNQLSDQDFENIYVVIEFQRSFLFWFNFCVGLMLRPDINFSPSCIFCFNWYFDRCCNSQPLQITYRVSERGEAACYDVNRCSISGRNIGRQKNKALKGLVRPLRAL